MEKGHLMLGAEVDLVREAFCQLRFFSYIILLTRLSGKGVRGPYRVQTSHAGPYAEALDFFLGSVAPFS